MCCCDVIWKKDQNFPNIYRWKDINKTTFFLKKILALKVDVLKTKSNI